MSHIDPITNIDTTDMTTNPTPAVPFVASSIREKVKQAKAHAGAAVKGAAKAIASVVVAQATEVTIEGYGTFYADETTARFLGEQALQKKLVALVAGLDLGTITRADAAVTLHAIIQTDLRPEHYTESKMLPQALAMAEGAGPLTDIIACIKGVIGGRSFAAGGAILGAARRVPDRLTVPRDPGQPLGTGARDFDQHRTYETNLYRR